MNAHRATLRYDVQVPVFEGEDIEYRTETVTATLSFSGTSDDPTVVAKYSHSGTN